MRGPILQRMWLRGLAAVTALTGALACDSAQPGCGTGAAGPVSPRGACGRGSLAAGRVTRELGGDLGTTAVTDGILAQLQ